MFWRLIAVVCGLTFLVNGCQILGDDQCKSVDIGGNRRALQYSCYRYANQGDMSQGAAGGLGIAIGLGMIGLAIGPAIARASAASSSARRPGSGYRPPGPNPSSARNAEMQLLKAAAWILKSVAHVGGKGSPEWNRARDALFALGDGAVTPTQAAGLLDAASSADLKPGMFDLDARQILLRIAVEVAFADGKVNAAEKTALEELAVRLRLEKRLVQVIIDLLKGQAGDRTDDLKPAYRTLGVQPGASVGEIRSAYKKLMLKHHPDRATPADRAEATKKTAEINAAYGLLMGRIDSDNSASTSQPKPPPKAQPKPPPKAQPKPPPKAQPKPPPKAQPKPKPPPKPPPVKEKPALCHACQRRMSVTAKFCGYCGTQAATKK